MEPTNLSPHCAVCHVRGRHVLGLPTDIPKASAVVIELLLRSQTVIAFAAVLIAFPAITCASVLRSYRTLPRRT